MTKGDLIIDSYKWIENHGIENPETIEVILAFRQYILDIIMNRPVPYNGAEEGDYE